MTAFIIINDRVAFHRSFDAHFADSENIYRVVSSVYTDGVLSIRQPRSQRKLGTTLEETRPEVKESGYLCRTGFDHYTIGDRSFTNDRGFYCSDGFLKLFSVRMVRGRSGKVLTRPYVGIISQRFARKYFGDDDPVGKTILQYPATELEIVGVFEDLPVNTHFDPDILISFHDDMHLPPPLKEDWGEFGFYTYLRLDPHADPIKLERAITRLCIEKNERRLSQSHSVYTFQLQPIRSIHTRSRLKNEIGSNVRGDYLNILQLISLFILMIAGFNYIYFTYVRLTGNSKQYGIRRVMGAGNRTFLVPFIAESCLIHLAALIISVTIIVTIRPLLANPGFMVSVVKLPPAFWYTLTLILLVSSVLNPLILLSMHSRKSTLMLLAGKDGHQRRNVSFRQLFTIVQFAIIVFLISAILGIGKQVRYLETKDKGMDIRNKLVIKTPAYMRRTSQRINNLDVFENDLAGIAGIRTVSVSNNTPGDTPAFSFSVSDHDGNKGIKTALFIADSAYMDAYGIIMLAGKGFSRTVTGTCIINETCMRLLGHTDPETILDKTIFLNDESGMQSLERRVTGVCSDFNFSNMKELPDPIVLVDLTEEMMWGNYTLSVMNHVDEQVLLTKIEPLFKRTFPNYSFDYYWVEDQYNKQFREENSILGTLGGFGLIAILLGVLSLLSMVRQNIQTRTREIGIRKVNGALPVDIILQLNRHFLGWIAGALIIGLPLSWYFLNNWLNSFAYKQSMDAWIFLLPGAVAILLGSLTVTIQSLKAARMNPAESVKEE